MSLEQQSLFWKENLIWHEQNVFLMKRRPSLKSTIERSSFSFLAQSPEMKFVIWIWCIVRLVQLKRTPQVMQSHTISSTLSSSHKLSKYSSLWIHQLLTLRVFTCIFTSRQSWEWISQKSCFVREKRSFVRRGQLT